MQSQEPPPAANLANQQARHHGHDAATSAVAGPALANASGGKWRHMAAADSDPMKLSTQHHNGSWRLTILCRAGCRATHHGGVAGVPRAGMWLQGHARLWDHSSVVQCEMIATHPPSTTTLSCTGVLDMTHALAYPLASQVVY